MNIQGQQSEKALQESTAKSPKPLDEIMFYILERAKCEENTDKYLENVLNYCTKDYQQS